MKNILSIGISGKKISSNKFLNINKVNFCYGNKISFTNIENEIMKSFTSINKSFNLNGNKKTTSDQSEEESKISLKMLKEKYLKQDSKNDTDNIIKVIFREEVLNIKKEKEYDNLILFIKNCKKYNYPVYLTDVKYFKNKEIKNFMTNTSLLENLFQKNSPFSIENEFQMKFKVQQLYKLRKGEKGEKLDRITEKEFEIEKYDYMNYLAETSTIEKIKNLRKLEKNNEKVLNEFHSKNNILENEENVEIKQEAWKNHYIQYLQKLKKNERKESLGASRFEEPFYNEAVKKNVNNIFKETSSKINDADENDEEKETIEGGIGGRYTQNDAKAMNDGTNEPFPYHDMEDFPIEEFLDTDATAPGADCLVYGALREVGKYELLPPKIDNYFDQFVIDSHKWGIFSSNVNQAVAMRGLKIGMQNVLQDILIRNKLNAERSTIAEPFNTDMPQSLVHYYNLLPKWARDHPSIKMLVRGLEFYQPWITYREKINMINMGLKFVIQRDKKYIEIYEEIYNSVPENITLENLPSLMEYNDDTERNILQHPDDEATDDEEFEFFQSAEEVRAIEKQEEEERKMKKKEEGRAKRAAEEAKQAASEGKVDKSAEEKKKKEEAEKKKKESEGAEEDEEGKAEDGEEDQESQARAEDESLKEEKMFSPNRKFRKDDGERAEELISIYDSLQKKLRGDNADKDSNEELNRDNDDEFSLDNSEDSKILKDEKEGIENFRKSFKEKKGIIQGKKNKIHDIINDLRTSENIKLFEENVQLLRKNLEENNIRFMQKLVNEKLSNTVTNSAVETPNQSSKTSEIDQSNDLIVFPMTLLSSTRLTENQKMIIRSTFAPYITQLTDKDKKDVTIQLDENVSKKTIEEAEFEILNKISFYENDSQEKAEGIDVSLEYKDSLRDDDLKVDESEELGLTDAYYKSRPPIDYVFRKEDPIPLDYYINEDGFWNDYIAFQKSKIDIKQITIKPFINISKQLKKKEQI